MSGFADLKKIYRRYVILGALGIALGLALPVLVGGATTWLALSMGVGIGLCFVALGVWGLRVGASAPVLTSSWNLLQSGRLAEASSLLDTLEANRSTGVVMSRELQRAMIAARAGDLPAAVAHADRVIAAPRRSLFGAVYEVQRGAALGLRAWARAAAGDLEGAEADIAAARGCSVPAPEGLARAALAEVTVLERRGDRAALGAALQRNRKLLMAGLEVRERAIVRAMQRMLKAAPTSVYRTAADPKKRGAEEGEVEPPIHEWIGRVAPDLVAFAPRPSAAAVRGTAPAQVTPSAEAVAEARKEASRKGRSPVVRVLVLWGLLIAMFLGIWQYLAPPQQHTLYPLPVPAAPAAPDPWLGVWGAAVVLAMVGLFTWLVRRNQAQTKRFQELASAIARGEDVDSELAELARSRQELTAAQAELLRAAVADRRAQLDEVLLHVAEGRGKLRMEGTRAAAAAILSPALAAARAYALACLGRVDEAAAEMALIPADYVFLDRTRFSVQLVGLVARGEMEAAGRLVEATPADLSIGPRDELVRDLVRAATAKEGAPHNEIARLRDELREDEESRRWIERVLPALLSAFERSAAAEDAEREAGADEESARDEAARREAAAEREADAEHEAAGGPRVMS